MGRFGPSQFSSPKVFLYYRFILPTVLSLSKGQCYGIAVFLIKGGPSFTECILYINLYLTKIPK